MARVEPAKPPYSPAVQECFNRVIPEGVKPPRIYRVLARNESLLVDLVEKGLLGPTGLFERGVLPTRLRELLILRTCVATGNDYEWRLHVDSGLSRLMGLGEEQIQDTHQQRPNDDLWDEGELAALELADNLTREFAVDDELFGRLREHYDEPTLIEMTQLVGWYATAAMQAALAGLRPLDHETNRADS